MSFIIGQKLGIPYLLAPNLTGHKGMLHAFTTRLGGVSEKHFSSLNLALHVGDQPRDVITNRKRLSAIFGLDLEDTVCVRQTHGTDVQRVIRADKGQGAVRYDDSVPEADALVTDQPGILLWCFYADCVPVLLFDPVKKVIAAVHAGWRGTNARIAYKTIEVMSKEYGSNPKDIQAAIGPSLGPCCFEVDSEVAKLFSDADFEASIIQPQGSKYRIDLWQANKQALMEAQLPEKNIEISELCTSCLTSLFFSFRAEKGVTGRIAAAITLNHG